MSIRITISATYSSRNRPGYCLTNNPFIRKQDRIASSGQKLFNYGWYANPLHDGAKLRVIKNPHNNNEVVIKYLSIPSNVNKNLLKDNPLYINKSWTSTEKKFGVSLKENNKTITYYFIYYNDIEGAPYIYVHTNPTTKSYQYYHCDSASVKC